MKSLQRKNKPQKIKAHLQLKQHPNRYYLHRGYCKQNKYSFSLTEFLVNLLGCAVVIGIIWYLITLI